MSGVAIAQDGRRACVTRNSNMAVVFDRSDERLISHTRFDDVDIP
jgi:hypothetical protein